MKISSKGRYALAAMIEMAQTAGTQDRVTVLSLAQRLNISKIFLEQVFSLLRRAGLLNAIKGAQGGYQLARPAGEISAYDILAATETTLFEMPESTVKTSAPGIEAALRNLVFAPVNDTLAALLRGISLNELAHEAQSLPADGEYMYYL